MYTQYTVLGKTLAELNDKPHQFVLWLPMQLTSPNTVIMDATSISFVASWSLPLSQHRTTPKAER